MEIILYSTGCPKCVVLKNKLKEKNINFIENNDTDEMIKLGFLELPILCIDGKIYNFIQAIKWVNEEVTR